MSKEPSKTSKTSKVEDEAKQSPSSAEKSPESPQPKTPPLVLRVQKIDAAIGVAEHAFVGVALFSLIAVGTYQFFASRLFGVNDTWPFEALRYLVFFCAMGGAALSAQKGRMISMDFLARKLAPKKRLILRILTSIFVIFACYLLYKGGMYVRAAAADEEYEVVKPTIALLALPGGAALIGVHYVLHAYIDALYLAAGLIPPEEEGPQAH